MPDYLWMAIFYVVLHPMKEKLFISLLACIFCVTTAYSQARVILPDSSQITTNRDSLDLLPREVKGIDNDSVQAVDRPVSQFDHLLNGDGAEADSLRRLVQMTIWKIDPRTGSRLPAVSDTLLHNYQQSVLPDGQSVAMGFLAPLGSPAFSKIFADRPETDQFIFNNAYHIYLKDPDKVLFLNTRIPYSRLSYNRSLPKQYREERFEARFASNFGKSLNVGLDVDLINTRGYYNSQSVKHNNFSLFGNYITDKIEAHAFMNLGSVVNAENGGITIDQFITHPDSVQQSFTSRDIPVKFTNTWNSLRNNRFFVSGRYNLGYVDTPSDSLHKGQGHFVPVATIGFSSSYRQQYRRFLSHDTTYVQVGGVGMQKIDQFYVNRFYEGAVDDSIRFSSMKNTVSLSLREGFQEWVKFGLTAFLEHDLRNYKMRNSEDPDMVNHRESAVTLGGILNKQQGDNLLFNIRADLGLLGANLGEFRAMGDIETGFDIAGKRTTLLAEAYIKNLRPKYLEENYYSKYFRWNHDFGDIRRVYVGGKLYIPFTNTTVSVGVENLQNFIYYNKEKQIAQESDNVQLLTARVEQNIRLGIFNWDNQVVYQTSSDENVIPVPKVSIYSNMYLKTKIVNELTLQLGVDARYHTKYFVPGYEPALLQFYNQREKEIGEYPIATLYANMHLKQTRFYVMFYNVASQFLNPKEYFSLPGYPVNPMVLRMGVSVNLHN
ncbi:putative porin [Proteiniphilum sp.]|uniref:putative porin n=1 Tax=Proteiniphilum sp. TaxID=1926877 RepID=UPI002B1EA254|nr:putative porin [Proteiniphilum sp.]MEA4917480.1 putative porin [Proteiniphilum sp.]